MSVAAYEAKFHALSHYATQLVRNEEERIHNHTKGLNTDLHLLSVRMNSDKKIFNEVMDYVKKIEGV